MTIEFFVVETPTGAYEGSREEFEGHTIEVRQLEGARPWAVYVDGLLVFGQGDRVRRRLAYSTRIAAQSAGRKHVREIVAGALK